MNPPVIILGAGLSGLYAAHLLHRAGVDVRVVEARDRIGGRILGVAAADGVHRYDLGPGWIWPSMNPRAAALVDALVLRLYPQHTAGGSVFEPDHGPLQRQPHTLASEPPSMRVIGGMPALVEALAGTLPADTLRLGDAVTALVREGDGVRVQLASGTALAARTVISTLPPRLLASTLRLDPAPEQAWLAACGAMPTWMAGQAKLVAEYAVPFWRDAGLSGTATSQRGPLVEIHDASDAAGTQAALFGFVGYPASARRQLGRESLVDAAIDQLARLFGNPAAAPRAVHLMDWSQETATATARDAEPVYAHPDYDPPRPPRGWRDALRLAGSECAPVMGGYIEGALAAAQQATDALVDAGDSRRPGPGPQA